MRNSTVFILIFYSFIVFLGKNGAVHSENSELDLNYVAPFSSAAEASLTGRLFFEQKYEQIIRELTAQTEPLRAKEKYLLALAHRSLKQNDSSLAILHDLNKTVVLLKPLVLYHLGNIKTESREYSEANSYYFEILKIAGAYPALMQEVLFKIVENCKQLNQPEAAEKHLNILMNEYVTDYSHYKDVFLNVPVKPDILLELARIKILRRQFNPAFNFINNILNNFENSDAAAGALNLLNAYKNDFKNLMTDAVKFKLAKVNINRGRFTEGLKILNELSAVEVYKNNDEFIYLNGWCFYRLGEQKNNAKAAEIFSRFRNEFANSTFGARALFYLGMIYQRQKEYDKEKDVMEDIIAKFNSDYYAFAAFKEIVEYYEDKKSVEDINNTLTRMIEYFNKPNKTDYLKRSLWHSFFYAYQMKNFNNSVELLNALNNLQQNPDEKIKTNFWLYKALNMTAGGQSINNYLYEIVNAADHESYYYWRAIDILQSTGNNVIAPISKIKIYTVERIMEEIEKNSASNDLYSILAEIKDYRGLLMLTQDVKGLSRNERILPLLLLLINGRYTEAISYAGAARGDKELYKPIMYPTAYYEFMLASCNNIGLDKALGFGIMREESRFSAKAVSRAGAIGLMQIMPATGNDINKSLKIPNFNRNSLFEPSINIQCGTFELKRLFDSWQSKSYTPLTSLIFSIASYNAGENAVRRWIPRFYSDLQDIDLFAELIPYRETRGYVNRVYKSYSVYKALYE